MAIDLKALLFLVPAASVALATGCGSTSGPAVPTISAARTFQLAGWSPAGPVRAGQATEIALTILQPSGAALTRYRTGSGPHTGIDLLVVSSGLGTFFYEDPPVAKDGSIRQRITFPAPGSYHVVVDAFPDTPGVPPNIQLFKTITVTGSGRPAKPASSRYVAEAGGYRFSIEGQPQLRAIEPAFMTIKVVDRQGRPVGFEPLDGALAHAIFFRAGTLDYFHTHVCASGIAGCTSASSGLPVGSTTSPGVLRVGVLLPLPGTWQLFLRTKIAGNELVTPFTLRVG